jgi:hypothetical protein
MKVFLRMLAAIALVIGLCSCASSTQILAEWNYPGIKDPPFRKVMVIGLFNDNTVRRVFEDVFARTLAANGTEVLVGYTYLPEPVIEKEKFENLLKEIGADAVLVSSLKKQEYQAEEIPNHAPILYGAYSFGYESTVVQYRLDTVKTNLYRVKDAELVWSGVAESVDQRNMEKEVAEFSKVVVKTLKERKYIYSPKNGN